MTPSLPNLDKLKIFADGAALAPMLELAKNPRIAGFTTNPTLMRKAGISDYRAFAREVLAAIRDKPISFEVFADEWADMKRQAREIATWGDNVYVKIPITNTRREPAAPLIRELTDVGVKLNVTAICTLDQVRETAQALRGGRSRHRASVGEPARAAQHRSGRRNGMRHHHRDERRSGQAADHWQRLGDVQSRDRADVPPRRRSGWVSVVTLGR